MFYKRDFWDKTAEFYDFAEAFNGKVYRKMTSVVKKLTREGGAVLECAAGTGELSLAAAEKAGTVVCTDRSEKMLKIAEKKAKASRKENIRFEERDIFHLYDGDESYDTVIAGNVLHLLSCPEKAVKELYRVTKKGGRLLLPTFMTGGKRMISIELYKLLGFKAEREYVPLDYIEMLKGCGVGRVKARVIYGKIPCCFAVIYK